jgi:predicted O-methyltransferase YrrM
MSSAPAFDKALQSIRHESGIRCALRNTETLHMRDSELAYAGETQSDGSGSGFSLDADVIQRVLQHARPLGHHESADDLNLGFGFLYYGLVRTLRPRDVVVIGSGFGFSVVCLALGLKDNARGQLHFIAPSYSLLHDGPFKTMGGTSQWDDPAKVADRFARFGVEGIVSHYRMRSDEYFSSLSDAAPRIDLAFIDGSHAYEDVRHDFCATLRFARKNTYILLHDTNIYVREMLRHAGVKRWLRALQSHAELFEAVDFPFSSGVAIVRVLDKDAWKRLPSSL